VSALVLAVSVGAAGGAATKAKQEAKPGQAKVLVVTIQDLELTDAQEAKIAEIRKQFRPKVQEAAKEMGTLVKEQLEKVAGVLTPEQKKKIEALKEEREDHRHESLAHFFASLKELDLTDAEMTKIGEIRKEHRARLETAVKNLEGVLTDAQKQAREEAVKAGKTRRDVLEALKLTDEQKGKATATAKELGGVVRDEVEKIRDVLTESQKEQLQSLQEERRDRVRDRMAHRIANLQDLNLTDEQKTRLAAIRQEYRAKIHEAGNKLRATIRDEVEQIVAVIK
jgi:Spy/CpxP family protein refolding chaperone